MLKIHIAVSFLQKHNRKEKGMEIFFQSIPDKYKMAFIFSIFPDGILITNNDFTANLNLKFFFDTFDIKIIQQSICNF